MVKPAQNWKCSPIVHISVIPKLVRATAPFLPMLYPYRLPPIHTYTSICFDASFSPQRPLDLLSSCKGSVLPTFGTADLYNCFGLHLIYFCWGCHWSSTPEQVGWNLGTLQHSDVDCFPCHWMSVILQWQENRQLFLMSMFWMHHPVLSAPLLFPRWFCLCALVL